MNVPLADPTTTPARPRRQSAISSRQHRPALIGLAGAVLITAAVGVGTAWLPRVSWASVSTPTVEDTRHTIADPAHAADKATQSDVRGAIAAVEEYYTTLGHYPTTAIHGVNSRGVVGQLDLDRSTPPIRLSRGTRLYYAPAAHAINYRICATNIRGTGKWYLYDSASGGSVKAIRPPTRPAVCA